MGFISACLVISLVGTSLDPIDKYHRANHFDFINLSEIRIHCQKSTQRKVSFIVANSLFFHHSK